jgi:predicted transcriptional regulator
MSARVHSIYLDLSSIFSDYPSTCPSYEFGLTTRAPIAHSAPPYRSETSPESRRVPGSQCSSLWHAISARRRLSIEKPLASPLSFALPTGDQSMVDDIEAGRRHVARIVASYLRHHKIDANEISPLIARVQASRPAPPPEPARTPAVPVRRSVHRDYIVCLECGFRGQVLRRHLMVHHGLDPAAYRAPWGLPADHPVISPRYSTRRSELAQQIGLGRLGRQPAAASDAGPSASKSPAPTASEAAPAAARRRGRPRRSQPAG